MDAIVKIAFKRRAYKGKQKHDMMKVYLVSFFNEKGKKYHIYITNIQKDILNVKDIAELYGARWNIELLFKEPKSKYALELVDTKMYRLLKL